jgi:K(+)-stimulated pyrophosphate-energized sodium pump
MSGTSITLAAESSAGSLSSSNVTFVIVAIVFALVALAFAAVFVKTVLANGRGTTNMQEIAGAVQEGASAYLFRQFKTLAIFVVIAVVLLFLLPVHNTDSETAVKVGRSLFFIVGAVFTPPDVISQCLLAVPLWLLYELGLQLARFVSVPEADAAESLPTS